MPLEISGVLVGVAIEAGWLSGCCSSTSRLIELQTEDMGED